MADVVVVNERDEVVGTMSKKEAHRTGARHRIAVVYVENGAGQFLVQVRMSGKLDHSAAGHVDPGESYLDAAKRELFEELGIAGVELARIGHGESLNELSEAGENRSHVFDVFKCAAEPGELQENEVKSVYWADADEVLREMSVNPDNYSGGFKASLPILVASR